MWPIIKHIHDLCFIVFYTPTHPSAPTKQFPNKFVILVDGIILKSIYTMRHTILAKRQVMNSVELSPFDHKKQHF
jgi:hypothetical protein